MTAKPRPIFVTRRPPLIPLDPNYTAWRAGYFGEPLWGEAAGAEQVWYRMGVKDAELTEKQKGRKQECWGNNRFAARGKGKRQRPDDGDPDEPQPPRPEPEPPTV